jgi:very-short-patch-repair endonuclease
VRDPREAVVAMDMAAAAGLVSVRRMAAYLDREVGTSGVRRARRALRLASELSRSPNETRMRLVWVLDAGLPRPLVNPPVFSRQGRFLGYVDLLDPEAGVVGEYDGADHRGAARHSKDVGREDRLRGAGLEVFRVTGPDLPRTDLLVERMRATRARAHRDGEDHRQWTTVPPPWWDEPPSLDELLDRRDVLRELHRPA